MKKLIILFIILNLFFVSCGSDKLQVNSFELSLPLLALKDTTSILTETNNVDNNVIYLSFEYVGRYPIRFENKDASIKYNSDKSICKSEGVYNIVSKKSRDKNNLEDEKVEFKTGNIGYFVFRDCPDFDSIDNFEGEINILYGGIQVSGSINFKITEVRKDIIIKSEPENLQ